MLGRAKQSRSRGAVTRPRAHCVIAIASALTVVTLHATVAAFTLSAGKSITCHSVNGQAVPEVLQPGLSGPFHAGYTGVTVVAPNGTAQITWDPQKLATLPSAVRDFIFFHECAHAHVPTSDELVANCIGLADMRKEGLATA